MSGDKVLVDAVELRRLQGIAARAEQEIRTPMPTSSHGESPAVRAARSAAAEWILNGSADDTRPPAVDA